MNPDFDAALLARIEDAGINASAPRQQRWIDGWLVRTCPGKAKRARCIQAVAAGRLSVDAKLTLCLPVYAEAGLHPYVRITPFSEPRGLDDALAGRGMLRIDDTRVMALAGLDGRASDAGALPISASSGPEFVEWVGRQRGSSEAERRAHGGRVADSPVPHHAVLMRDTVGNAIAGGQVVTEGGVAGLYDVFTAEHERGRGHAGAVCRHLLDAAFTAGARVAYLQVDAGNEAARRVYRGLGFVDAYAYHYRSPPQGTSE